MASLRVQKIRKNASGMNKKPFKMRSTPVKEPLFYTWTILHLALNQGHKAKQGSDTSFEMRDFLIIFLKPCLAQIIIKFSWKNYLMSKNY